MKSDTVLYHTQQRRCRWREEKKDKREKPHVLNVGGGENNCKLLIIRQPCVRPSDHLLTQKMRALECGQAHNFSACVTGKKRKQNRVEDAWKGTGQRSRWPGGKEGERGGGEKEAGWGGGGEKCQTASASAERRRRKEGGSVPCVHFLGHRAWPLPSGANHSILDNFLKHLNPFPAPQQPRLPQILSWCLGPYWFFTSYPKLFFSLSSTGKRIQNTSPKGTFKESKT